MPLKVVALWALVLFLGLVVLTCAVWLLATPVEDTSTVTSGGHVVAERTQKDYSQLILPGVFLAGAVAAFLSSIIFLIRAYRPRAAEAQPGDSLS